MVCEISVPILWRDPWKYLNMKRKASLLNVIISHLSDETKNNLIKNQKIFINSFNTNNINSYQKPLLFNYINFCKHLNLNIIMNMISIIETSKKSILQNEIFNLFINENTRITHLYIPQIFNYQIHLIPEAKRCFSEIEFLSCYTRINDNILTGLTEICKSIKELRLFVELSNNNYGITKLIKIQKKLVIVQLIDVDLINYRFLVFQQDKEFCKVLENSLIKHANTIQCFKRDKPLTTKILLYLVNLKELVLCDIYGYHINNWDCLENLSLPSLQILKSYNIPIKYLSNLMKNTNGSLIEIKINHFDIDDGKIIQVIYQNCPKLKYLKLPFENSNILKLENLLINCNNLQSDLYVPILYVPIIACTDKFFMSHFIPSIIMYNNMYR